MWYPAFISPKSLPFFVLCSIYNGNSVEEIESNKLTYLARIKKKNILTFLVIGSKFFSLRVFSKEFLIFASLEFAININHFLYDFYV